MSLEEFSRWWLSEHAPLARQLPGLKQAVFNLVKDGQEQDYDGISELWFKCQDDFESAYQSEIGKRVAADSLSRVSRRERLFVDEHQILKFSD